MTPTEILTPIVILLAFYGYIICLSRFVWLTCAATLGLGYLVSLSYPVNSDTGLNWWGAVALVLAAFALARVSPDAPKTRAEPRQGAGKTSKVSEPTDRQIVIDGTNVMYWNGAADLSTLTAVVHSLKARRFLPYVFLDASSRHHLGDKTLNERGFAKALGLHRSRVMVCPAETEADVFILKFARQEGLPILSNDRFRDRAQQAKGIKMVKGIFANGKPIFDGL